MKHIAFLSLFLSVLIGCTSNKVDSGDSTQKTELPDKSILIKNNDHHYKWHQQVQGGLYSVHPGLTKYIQKIGARLAKISKHPSLPYEFVVVNHDAPHAICLLSGKIAVNRGLLLTLDNEAELAAVLAQNIALSPILYNKCHLDKWALFQADRDDLKKYFLEGLKYTPLPLALEKQLDEAAMRHLKKAGYDPSALLSVHEKLSRQKKVTPTHKGLSVHPFTNERIESTKTYLKKYATGGYLGKTPYEESIKPLKLVKRAYYLYEKGKATLDFGYIEDALELAVASISIEPLEPLFHLLKGQCEFELGHLDFALKSLNRSIQLDPNFYQSFLVRGKCYHIMDELEKAINDIETSLSMLPTAEGFYLMGICLAEKNEPVHAKAHFEEIASLATKFSKFSQDALTALK